MYKGKYEQNTAKTAEKPKKKRKILIGTVVFYTLYVLGVGAALWGIFSLMTPLENWLQTYQASQPENKCQEIFDQLFAQPDWAALYTQAGVEDTTFEGSDAYAAYMTEKVGDEALKCIETSAGLSGDRKYLIRHNNENIASFTMTGTENEKTMITTWALDKLELFYARTEGVTVLKAADQTVYINGVALDDSYTVQTTATLAEGYLPEGVHGYRTAVQQLDGLLVEPVVQVKNADGTDCPVTVDENGTYVARIPSVEITEEEQKMAIGAAKANALYAIRAITQRELRQHFDSKSQIYKDICATVVFMQDYQDYRFDNSATVVSDFYRYSEDMFSAHVALVLKVTRINGTVKTYEAATTYIFTRQESGEFRVTDITNIKIQQRCQQVRLSFVMDQQTESRMVDTDAKTLTLPQVTPPDGHALRGWAKQEKDETGRTVMTIVFTPDENGQVHLSGTQPLEPMTLYPIFDKQ
jgi:hypothetical protein